jgi:hypothetical protein
MKLVIIASAVDHGTRAINTSYVNKLSPSETYLIQHEIRELGLHEFLNLRSEIRRAAKSADVVLCLHHGAILASGLFLRQSKKRRLVGLLDWTRQYPSRRKERKIQAYAWFLLRILRRFSAVCSPVAGMRDFYAPSIQMLPILYPLPYPDVDLESQDLHDDGITRVLFIGADIQRKGGDILLRQWQQQAPATSHLTFVAPECPVGEWRHVEFINNIKPFTPEHRKLLESHSVFVLPSHREAYGYAALEALNFGQVVVTTENAGVSRLVAEAGGIVGKTSEDAVRLAMELLQQPEEIARRRAVCRSFMAGYEQRFHELIKGAFEGSPPH